MNSIKTELKLHVEALIEDGSINQDNWEDAHKIAFNESYYITGYYQCEKWLEKHNVGAWEAIEIVQDYENNTFGTVNTKIDSESIVNMLVYIIGEEVISEMDLESIFEDEL